MSTEIRNKLAGDVKNIETYVKNKLKEFEESHGRMSNELRRSLTAYANTMARGIGKLLREYHADMGQARNSWETISTPKGIKGEAAAPSVEFTGRVSTAKEKIEREQPGAEKMRRGADIKEKELGYINKHPEGVRAGDMEPVFGISRMRLGTIAKKLLEDGMIRKTGNLYYPVSYG
jgi:hypothetical protein